MKYCTGRPLESRPVSSRPSFPSPTPNPGARAPQRKPCWPSIFVLCAWDRRSSSKLHIRLAIHSFILSFTHSLIPRARSQDQRDPAQHRRVLNGCESNALPPGHWVLALAAAAGPSARHIWDFDLPSCCRRGAPPTSGSPSYRTLSDEALPRIRPLFCLGTSLRERGGKAGTKWGSCGLRAQLGAVVGPQGRAPRRNRAVSLRPLVPRGRTRTEAPSQPAAPPSPRRHRLTFPWSPGSPVKCDQWQ